MIVLSNSSPEISSTLAACRLQATKSDFNKLIVCHLSVRILTLWIPCTMVDSSTSGKSATRGKTNDAMFGGVLRVV